MSLQGYSSRQCKYNIELYRLTEIKQRDGISLFLIGKVKLADKSVAYCYRVVGFQFLIGKVKRFKLRSGTPHKVSFNSS